MSRYRSLEARRCIARADTLESRARRLRRLGHITDADESVREADRLRRVARRIERSKRHR